MTPSKITYTDRAGEQRQGEVWSAGPAPRSVWVLGNGGSAVAVHMDRRTELPDVPTDPRADACATHKVPACTDGYCRDRASMVYLTKFRYGPVPIRATEWRRAVELFRVES